MLHDRNELSSTLGYNIGAMLIAFKNQGYGEEDIRPIVEKLSGFIQKECEDLVLRKDPKEDTSSVSYFLGISDLYNLFTMMLFHGCIVAHAEMVKDISKSMGVNQEVLETEAKLQMDSEVKKYLKKGGLN